MKTKAPSSTKARAARPLPVTRAIPTGNPGLSFGLGPMVVALTGTDDPLGAGKWQLGLANMFFSATSKAVQWGYLASWQASVAGEDRGTVSLGSLRPFLNVQLGNG